MDGRKTQTAQLKTAAPDGGDIFIKKTDRQRQYSILRVHVQARCQFFLAKGTQCETTNAVNKKYPHYNRK